MSAAGVMTSQQTAARSRVAVLVAVLAGVLLVAGAVGLRFYEPLTWNGYVSPGGTGATLVDDPLFGSAAVLDGPAGSTATVVYSVRNDGHLPVTVFAPGADGTQDDIVDVRWAPVLGPGTTFGGVRPDPEATSMRVGPGEEVAMWVTVTKSSCGPGVTSTLDVVPIRWGVFGLTKVQQFQLSPKGPPPLVLCKA